VQTNDSSFHIQDTKNMKPMPSITKRIDRLIFALVMLLAALPFQQILLVSIGPAMVNAFEIIYILLIVFLSFRILFIGCTRYGLPLLLFCYILVFYALISFALHPNLGYQIINQVRISLPFIVALFLLFGGTTIPCNRILFGLSFAALLSSSFAMYFHFYNQEFLSAALSANKEVVDITVTWGRMYWPNALLLFFDLLALIYIKKPSVMTRVVLYLSTIVSAVAFFNTLNRTIIIGLFLFLVGSFAPNNSLKMLLSRIRKVLPVAVALGLGVFVVMIHDERVRRLVNLRYFGDGRGITAVFDTALRNRMGLYKEYLSSLLSHFPVGQGLGLPLSSQTGNVYTTDISLLSFMLPYGIFGLAIFLIFLVCLYRLIQRIPYAQLRKSLLLLYLVSIVMSLNLDVFSRNNFVIFFVFLVMSSLNQEHSCNH